MQSTMRMIKTANACFADTQFVWSNEIRRNQLAINRMIINDHSIL